MYKSIILAASLLFASSSQLDAGPVGGVVVGAMAGYGYEKVLYNLPAILGIPGALFCIAPMHLIGTAIVEDDKITATISGLTALATMVLLYMKEKDTTATKEHIVVVHAPYPQYMEYGKPQPIVAAPAPATTPTKP